MGGSGVDGLPDLEGEGHLQDCMSVFALYIAFAGREMSRLFLIRQTPPSQCGSEALLYYC